MRPSALLSLSLCIAAASGCGSTSSTPPTGTTTTPSGGTCSSPIGVSEAPPANVQHLGSVQVGQTVSFTVPANAASITIVEQAVTAPATINYKRSTSSSFSKLDNTAVPLEVHDPTGRLIYNDNPTIPVTDPDTIAQSLAFFASNAPTVGTLTIPNTTGGLGLVGSAGLPSGTWTVTVSDWAYECTFTQAGGATCSGGSTASTYDVSVILKPTASTGGIPSSGNIDVVVYFATTTADAPAGTAPLALKAATANAGNDPDLNQMEKTLTYLLGKAGINVRSVTYVDLPADVQSKYASGVNVDNTGDCSEIAQLFRYGTGGNTLNIFFVSSFTAANLSDGTEVVGLDGTIPGPATVGGTAGSGAAVATGDLRFGRRNCSSSANTLNLLCGADQTAYFIAHEAGHFLGMYHVTESDGTAFDPLLETPMCQCQTCAPDKTKCADYSPAPSASTMHQMTVADCTKSSSCSGGDNLMFWILDVGSQGTLFGEQQRVMRANPLVQ